jgi:CBS domain containing-hemolysin-like protein
MVSDKRGNLTGLITLEDVIESLVGTIEDEYDRPPVMMVRLAEHRWRIGGGVMTTTVREKITGELPDIPGTIDDLVKSRLQGVELKENHQLRFGGISMKIRRVSRGFVYDVVIEKSGPARK